MIRFSMGEPTKALEAYRYAIDTFSAIGELESVAALYGLRAEILDYQGAAVEAWDQLYEGLSLAPVISDPQRLYALYANLGFAAFKKSKPEAAAIFQAEAIRYAHELNNPVAEAYAHFWQARFLDGCGQPVESKEELRLSRALASNIRDPWHLVWKPSCCCWKPS